MRSDTHLRIFLLGSTLLIFSLTLQFHHDSVMDFQIFELTRSLVEKGSFELAPSSLYLDFDLSHGKSGNLGTLGQNGESFSPYGLLSVLLIPFYLVGQMITKIRGVQEFPFLISQFSAIFWIALLVQLLFTIFRRFELSPARASFFALAAILCTPLWHQGVFINRDLPMGVLGILSFTLLLYRRQSLDWKICLNAGAICGVGFLVKSIGAVYFIPLGLYILLISHRLKNLLAFAVGISGFIVIWLFYNSYRFGSFFHFEEVVRNTPTQPTSSDSLGQTLDLFSHSFLEGGYGLLFSTGKGIFLFAPILILFFFTSRNFYRKAKAEWITLNLIFGSALLVYSMWKYWHAPGFYGPWFLTPFIPCLLVQIVPFQQCRKWFKPVGVILLVISFFLQLWTVLPSYQEFYSKMDIIFQSFGAHSSQSLKLLDQRMLFDPSYSPVRGLSLLTNNQVFANRFFPGFGDGLSLQENLYPILVLSFLLISFIALIISFLRPRLAPFLYPIPIFLWIFFFLWFCLWFDHSRLTPRARRDFIAGQNFLEQGRPWLARFFFKRALHFDHSLQRQVSGALVNTLYLPKFNELDAWDFLEKEESSWKMVGGSPPYFAGEGKMVFSEQSAIQSPQVSLEGKKIVMVGLAYRVREKISLDSGSGSKMTKNLMIGHFEILYFNEEQRFQRQLIEVLGPSSSWETISTRLLPPPGSISCALRVVTQGSIPVEIRQPTLVSY